MLSLVSREFPEILIARDLLTAGESHPIREFTRHVYDNLRYDDFDTEGGEEDMIEAVIRVATLYARMGGTILLPELEEETAETDDGEYKVDAAWNAHFRDGI